MHVDNHLSWMNRMVRWFCQDELQRNWCVIIITKSIANTNNVLVNLALMFDRLLIKIYGYVLDFLPLFLVKAYQYYRVIGQLLSNSKLDKK